MAKLESPLPRANDQTDLVSAIKQYVGWIVGISIGQNPDLNALLKAMRINAAYWADTVYPAIISTCSSIKNNDQAINSGFDGLIAVLPQLPNSDPETKKTLLRAFADPLGNIFKNIRNSAEALKASTTAFHTKISNDKNNAPTLMENIHAKKLMLHDNPRQYTDLVTAETTFIKAWTALQNAEPDASRLSHVWLQLAEDLAAWAERCDRFSNGELSREDIWLMPARRRDLEQSLQLICQQSL